MSSLIFSYCTEAFSEAVEFWRDAVGFEVEIESLSLRDPEEERVATVKVGDGAIEIIEAPNVRPGEGSWIRIEVEDVDAVFERLTRHGVQIPHGPTDMARQRDFSVNEPNGLLVAFFTPH